MRKSNRFARDASRRLLVLAVVGLNAASGCLSSAGLEPPPPGGVHVLFIGNSLTYVNDLPATVRSLGALVGDTIRTAMVTGPDLALIDHWTGATNARQAIELGGWHYVVLQQGPSTLPVNRDTLILAAKLFAPSIHAVGAKPALFMVWPTIDRLAFFDAVRASYQDAAAAVDGVFLPAGEGWINAWAADSTLGLYAADGLHPSPLGTYVAALVIYERLTGHDARALPPTALIGSTTLATPAATVRLLQAAAHEANVEYP